MVEAKRGRAHGEQSNIPNIRANVDSMFRLLDLAWSGESSIGYNQARGAIREVAPEVLRSIMQDSDAREHARVVMKKRAANPMDQAARVVYESLLSAGKASKTPEERVDSKKIRAALGLPPGGRILRSNNHQNGSGTQNI